MKKLWNMAKGLITDIKRFWKVPDSENGKYISYKEMTAYSVGGTGVYFIISLVGIIVLNAGSMLVGASIGLKAVDLQTMTVASSVIGMFIAPFRAVAFDNTRNKMGKFRPYLLYMGLPTSLFATLLVYLPYDSMDYSQKLVSVFIVYNILQLFSPFYSAAYSGLVQVLSPNTKERAWVIEVSSIIYSFAPTVVNPVLPLIGPLDSIKTYRIAFPVFCTIGVALSMLCVFGTKEKIIVPRQYVAKVRFFDGLKKVADNKYFWILNISAWLNFFTGGYGYLFPWIFYYGMNNPKIYALMTILKGEASTPGMLLGAPLANKFGKKNICIFSMFMQAACIALMIICYKSYVMIFIMMFIKDIFGALSIIYTPAMKADVMDYQQYKTGDRLEGFIEQTGALLGSIVGIFTGYFIPLVLKSYGLTNNYDSLYNAEFRNPILYAIIIWSLIGTVLSVIPYFFYDLSEEKRENMINVLKIRVMFDDYRNNDLSDKTLTDTVTAVHKAQEIYNAEFGKNNKKQLSSHNAAAITVNEINKFNSDYYMLRVETARQLVANSAEGLRTFNKDDYVIFNKMSEFGKEDKKQLHEIKTLLKQIERSSVLIEKLFPNGISEPDEAELLSALAMPEATRQETKLKNKAVKNAELKQKLFHDAAQPYVDAKKLVDEYNSYCDWNKIEDRYNNIVSAQA